MRGRNFEKVEKVRCTYIKITNVKVYCVNHKQEFIFMTPYIYFLFKRNTSNFIYNHLIVIYYIIVGVKAWEMIFSGYFLLRIIVGIYIYCIVKYILLLM